MTAATTCTRLLRCRIRSRTFQAVVDAGGLCYCADGTSSLVNEQRDSMLISAHHCKC
jgi:hypothetical protein